LQPRRRGGCFLLFHDKKITKEEGGEGSNFISWRKEDFDKGRTPTTSTLHIGKEKRERGGSPKYKKRSQKEGGEKPGRGVVERRMSHAKANEVESRGGHLQSRGGTQDDALSQKREKTKTGGLWGSGSLPNAQDCRYTGFNVNNGGCK